MGNNRRYILNSDSVKPSGNRESILTAQDQLSRALWVRSGEVVLLDVYLKLKDNCHHIASWMGLVPG